MSNRWICDIALLVPAASRAAAAKTASMFSGNPNDDTLVFFSRAVRPIGGLEATHYLSHSRMRESVLMQLPGISIMFPGALYNVTRHDDDSEIEAASRLRTDDWLASIGLELIEEEEE